MDHSLSVTLINLPCLYVLCMHTFTLSVLSLRKCPLHHGTGQHIWTCIQVPRSQSSQTVSHTGYLCVCQTSSNDFLRPPEDLTKGEELLSLYPFKVTLTRPLNVSRVVREYGPSFLPDFQPRQHSKLGQMDISKQGSFWSLNS